MPEVMIGKYTIESLTTGMYTDPYVIFREYIQNAADAIDEAVQLGILTREAAYISITIDSVKHRIVIEDNGIGIRNDDAYQILSDIGNSRKTQGVHRGFRGIGRFSGLSYCDKLTFVTSSVESCKSYSITFDSKKLRQLISSDPDAVTANDAMSKIITEHRSTSSIDTHFFRVVMDAVHEETGLLNADRVYDYLRQIAPVPFDRSFSWGQSVIDTVEKEIGKVDTYHIILISKGKRIDITKPYTDVFLLNRQTGATDTVSGIAYFPIKGLQGQTIGIAWYGQSKFQGTIIGTEVKGIRVRVGNILVGDYTTLNHIFKDPRFNGWVIGEVYINDANLIPNARRDDFEHNDAYYLLVERLSSLAAEIVKEIRSASASRNKPLGNALHVVDSIEAKTDEVLSEERISAARKGQITSKIIRARQQLSVQEFTGVDEEARQAAIEKLDILTGRIQESASFRALNLLPDMTKADKLLLERVFIRLLDQYPAEEADHCIELILSVLGPRS